MTTTRKPASGAAAIQQAGLLTRLLHRLRPGLAELDPINQVAGEGDVLGVIYGIPLALGGLAWLARQTDLGVLLREAYFLGLLAVLILLLAELKFYLIEELQVGRYANSHGSLDGMALWAGLFLVGPTVLWLGVFSALLGAVRDRPRRWSAALSWNWVRNLSQSLASLTLAPLAALTVYQSLGGAIPLPSLGPADLLRAFGALAVYALVYTLVHAGFVGFVVAAHTRMRGWTWGRRLARFLFLALGLPQLAIPFGVLAAGLYSQNGLLSFLFLMAGLVAVAGLTRQLSVMAERDRQHSRQLEKLEQLSRAIIQSSPENRDFTEILRAHVPAMFPSGRVAIWILEDEFLLVHPDDWTPSATRFWEWIRHQEEGRALRADERLPWGEPEDEHPPVIVAPIIDVESKHAIGGIYIELLDRLQPWDSRSLLGQLPAAQSLAGQIASSLREARLYAEALEHQRLVQELRLAGEIQASFFPQEFPIPPGWELAVTILPARETSGDYFDLIPLTDGRLGVLIADVADKGVGPALYMALSRTLIRTYAQEFMLDPDVVLYAANARILEDARASLFVTAFYSILDPETGVLAYSNAGHHPGLLVRTKEGNQVQSLTPTGMPIGVESAAVWRSEHLQIEPGDVLLLYTDGIPDAQNNLGELFGQDRLVALAQSMPGKPAQEVQRDLIRALQDFVGEAPQVDDITLMVLIRGNND